MHAPFNDCAMKGGVCSTAGLCERYEACLEQVSSDYHHGFAQGYTHGHAAGKQEVTAEAYKAGLEDGKSAGLTRGRHEGRTEEQKETPRRFLRTLEDIKSKAEEKASFLDELIEELKERYPSAV